jgi:hypothetical protein
MFSIVALMAMAALFVGIILALAPTIGGTIEDAQPTLGQNSSWNVSSVEGADMPQGGDWFAENFVWVGLVFLGMGAGIVIKVIMG